VRRESGQMIGREQYFPSHLESARLTANTAIGSGYIAHGIYCIAGIAT